MSQTIDLLKNPQQLLLNQPPEDYGTSLSTTATRWPECHSVFSAVDGLVGTVLRDGRSFITSPNYSIIYEPPLGGDRNVYLRDNYRFGPDDPLQWPQPFIPSFSHIITIRLPVRKSTDPLCIMWWIPQYSDFVPDWSGLIVGLGRLDYVWLSHLKKPCVELLERQKRFTTRTEFVPVLSALLETHLHRLEHLLTNFGTVLQLTRAVQRLYLELLALIDYLDIYQPWMCGTTAPPIKPDHVMGAFVKNLTHCEALVCAGIRVWLIRPSTEVPNARIRSIVDVRPPDGLLPLTALEPKAIIFSGSATSQQKYQAIWDHLHNRVCYPNPFPLDRAAHDPHLPIEATSSTSTETRAKRKFNPCKSLPWWTHQY